jgi:hypothetical protein
MAEGARRIGIQPLQLFIFNDALQVNQHLLTGNSDIIYAFAYYDLSAGPIVVDLPEGEFFGSILDAWQRPIEDLGKVGPDAGKGGRYLIVPPGYLGKITANGYIVRQSQTTTGMVFLRSLLTPDRSKAEGTTALRNARIHRQGDTDVIAPRLLDHSDYDGLPPRGEAFFELLAHFISRETPNERDRVMLGLLSTLGIEPGKPFKPDEHLRKLLARAAEQARSMMANMSYAPRFPIAMQSIFPGTPLVAWNGPHSPFAGRRTADGSGSTRAIVYLRLQRAQIARAEHEAARR